MDEDLLRIQIGNARSNTNGGEGGYEGLDGVVSKGEKGKERSGGTRPTARAAQEVEARLADSRRRESASASSNAAKWVCHDDMKPLNSKNPSEKNRLTPPLNCIQMV